MNNPVEFRKAARRMCDELVSVALTDRCVLSFDKAGLHELTRFWEIRKQASKRPLAPKNELEALSNYLGGFLGEVCTAQHGGDWTLDSQDNPSFRLGGTTAYVDFLKFRAQWIQKDTDFVQVYEGLESVISRNAFIDDKVRKKIFKCGSGFALIATKLVELHSKTKSFLGLLRSDGSRELVMLMLVTQDPNEVGSFAKVVTDAAGYRLEGDQTALKVTLIQAEGNSEETEQEKIRQHANHYLSDVAVEICIEFHDGGAVNTDKVGIIAAFAVHRASGERFWLSYPYFRANGSIIPRDLECPELERVVPE